MNKCKCSKLYVSFLSQKCALSAVKDTCMNVICLKCKSFDACVNQLKYNMIVIRSVVVNWLQEFTQYTIITADKYLEYHTLLRYYIDKMDFCLQQMNH